MTQITVTRISNGYVLGGGLLIGQTDEFFGASVQTYNPNKSGTFKLQRKR